MYIRITYNTIECEYVTHETDVCMYLIQYVLIYNLIYYTDVIILSHVIYMYYVLES